MRQRANGAGTPRPGRPRERLASAVNEAVNEYGPRYIVIAPTAVLKEIDTLEQEVKNDRGKARISDDV